MDVSNRNFYVRYTQYSETLKENREEIGMLLILKSLKMYFVECTKGTFHHTSSTDEVTRVLVAI